MFSPPIFGAGLLIIWLTVYLGILGRHRRLSPEVNNYARLKWSGYIAFLAAAFNLGIVTVLFSYNGGSGMLPIVFAIPFLLIAILPLSFSTTLPYGKGDSYPRIGVALITISVVAIMIIMVVARLIF